MNEYVLRGFVHELNKLASDSGSLVSDTLAGPTGVAAGTGVLGGVALTQFPEQTKKIIKKIATNYKIAIPVILGLIAGAAGFAANSPLTGGMFGGLIGSSMAKSPPIRLVKSTVSAPDTSNVYGKSGYNPRF